MTLKDKYAEVIRFFSYTIPKPQTELKYNNEFELLVAVVLSAQCTDKRVNLITPALFHRFPDAEKLSKASAEEIKKLIKQCTYPNNKAKHLSELAKKLHEDYKGQLPRDVKSLQSLPGVGRKTAHVIASVLFGQPVFPVDTHVFRVANRIGLTPGAKTMLDSEQLLTQYFSDKLIPKAHHWLILHGRYICKARTPLCEKCGLSEICSFYKS
jgi:endonuclease III